jgi:hypothetical protein
MRYICRAPPPIAKGSASPVASCSRSAARLWPIGRFLRPADVKIVPIRVQLRQGQTRSGSLSAPSKDARVGAILFSLWRPMRATTAGECCIGG